MPPVGNEMWISDTDRGLSHIDLRENKSRARRWELSSAKIGCVSVNPTSPTTLLTASNERTLKYVHYPNVVLVIESAMSECGIRVCSLIYPSII